MTSDYRRAWLARSADPGWRFPDPSRPYLRVPAGSPSTPEPGPRWNILYIQLESLRGVDTGFLNGSRRPSPTPYLDGLARRPDAAVWTRALSFGMPSINGIFATHCSIKPPSRRYITALTHVDFLCLPTVLRAHGYRAEMFHGDDTDWDNSTLWFQRWYDRLWRYPHAGRRDREVFRAAAAAHPSAGPFGAPVLRDRRLGQQPYALHQRRSGRRHGRLGDAPPSESSTRPIIPTTWSGELIESLRGEPWFDRTLIVVTGDHGFNVGEHGQVPGQHNLYRESLWVPLIVAGPHPRLPRGAQGGIVSHLDLAPTLADLLGLRVANPWQGHSLLAVRGEGGIAFGFRDSLAAESADWTAVRDPGDGEPRLFRTRYDWLQRHDLARERPGFATAAAGPGRAGAAAQRLSARSRPDLANSVVELLEQGCLPTQIEPALCHRARRCPHSMRANRPSRAAWRCARQAHPGRVLGRGSRSRRR